jgi:hypothetical protein
MSFLTLILALLLTVIFSVILTIILEPIAKNISFGLLFLFSRISKKDDIPKFIGILFCFPELIIISIIWVSAVNSSILIINEFTFKWYFKLIIYFPTFLGMLRFLDKWYKYRIEFINKRVAKNNYLSFDNFDSFSIFLEQLGFIRIIIVNIVFFSVVYFSFFSTSSNHYLTLVYNLIKSILS